jgi:hypothetical protein
MRIKCGKTYKYILRQGRERGKERKGGEKGGGGRERCHSWKLRTILIISIINLHFVTISYIRNIMIINNRNQIKLA